MISIIMPVYNSEKFLKSAIESVLQQSYIDFELILIDDGSTDNSGSICDYYANKDSRIKVVHQKNGGICIARNKGLQLAKGEYISFIDNDDLFDKYLLEDNYLLAQKYDADIVTFGVGNFENETCIERFDTDKKHIYYYSEKDIQSNYFWLRSNYLSNVWNKLFRRELIFNNQIIFQESFKFGYEDYIFNIQSVCRAKNMVANSKRYYIHFARMNHSTSLKYNFNRIESLLEGYEIENKECARLNIDLINLTGMQAFYIKICARELYGKDKELSLKRKKKILEEFSFNEKDKKFSTLKQIFRIDKIATIEWFLYCHKLYLLLDFFVNVLKVRAKILKKYF